MRNTRSNNGANNARVALVVVMVLCAIGVITFVGLSSNRDRSDGTPVKQDSSNDDIRDDITRLRVMMKDHVSAACAPCQQCDAPCEACPSLSCPACAPCAEPRECPSLTCPTPVVCPTVVQPPPPVAKKGPEGKSGRLLPKYSTFCADRTRPSVAADDSRWPVIMPSVINQFPDDCSTEFATHQMTLFEERVVRGSVPATLPVYCCEHDELLQHYARISPNPNKVLFDIGANKGYDLGLYYSLWTNWTKNIIWQHTHLHPGCPWYMDSDRVVFPRVFAFEPSPTTYQSLEDLTEQLPFCELTLENIAMSNKGGTATFSKAPAGDEGAKILNAQEISANNIQTVDVTVTTFDDYVTAHGLTHIDYINIDAEGFDWYVVDGMEKSLRAGIIDMFSFEAGESPGRSIEGTVTTLTKYGYDSYMMIHQRLIKLTGNGCWNPQWNMDRPIGNTGHAKPNILCVRRSWSLRHAVLSPFIDTRAVTLLQQQASTTAATTVTTSVVAAAAATTITPSPLTPTPSPTSPITRTFGNDDDQLPPPTLATPPVGMRSRPPRQRVQS